MSFMKQLPRYRCHKVVSALQIERILPNPRGCELHFTDKSFCPHQVDFVWMRKHDPVPGGYLVAYDDGYLSFSPREAFEAGYTLLTDAPEFPSPPELSIVWHADPESILRAHWKPIAAAEGIDCEELCAGQFGGQTVEGEVVEFSLDDMIAGLREQGCWGFIDHNTNTIHAWAAPDCDRALLLHMLAHEVGHATGAHHRDELQEEMRAEQFGAVAAMAYRFMGDRMGSTQAMRDVMSERRRQIDGEGWSADHDDAHAGGVLASAAGCYALFTDAYPNPGQPPSCWPWAAHWWKPKDYRRDLVRAAALLVAEIERVDRLKDATAGDRACCGRNCTSVDGTGHSAECQADYDSAVFGGGAP